MTDITTPAQMREAAARLAEKRAKYTMEAIKNATASALVSNIVTVTEAKVAHFIAAAIRALPVAEPEPQPPVTLTYTNWRGETAKRTIIPQSIWFGSTEWHPEPQWLLRAWDCEKQAERDFALKDFGQKPEPMAVTVKPLVWHKSHMSGWNGDWHTVPTGYTIRCADENGWKWSTPLGSFGYERSPEAAKSAAEADHAARILSQIEAVSAAQVRAEALEEAAKLPPYDGDGDPAGPFDHHVFVKRDAIRALIEKENFYLYLCAR